MKRLILNIAILLFINSLILSQAWARNNKIIYVDIEFIIENTYLKKTFQEEYIRKRKDLQNTKYEKEKALYLIKDRLRQQKFLLGHQEYLKEFSKIHKKLTEYEAEILKLRKSLTEWEKDTMASIFDDLLLIMEVISTEEKIGIILSKEPNIIYSDNNYDYTQKVVELLNEIDERSTPTAK